MWSLACSGIKRWGRKASPRGGLDKRSISMAQSLPAPAAAASGSRGLGASLHAQHAMHCCFVACWSWNLLTDKAFLMAITFSVIKLFAGNWMVCVMCSGGAQAFGCLRGYLMGEMQMLFYRNSLKTLDLKAQFKVW